MANKDTYTSYQTEEYYIKEEPFYLPVADEVELFEVAYSQQMPILLKGPTGTGKTRFVEYMCYRLGKPLTKITKKSQPTSCLLYTSPSPRDRTRSRMPSSA